MPNVRLEGGTADRAAHGAHETAAIPIRVVVSVPDFERRGGVSGYYISLQSHLASDVCLLTAGQREGEHAFFERPFRMVADYARFLRRIRSNHVQAVHLNPSIVRKALIRDSVFIVIAKALRKPCLIFIHGWNAQAEHIFRRLWFVYRRADAMIVLADEFTARLRAFGYNGPIYHETTIFDDRALRPKVRNRQGRDTRFNVLFLARVVKEKGIFQAIDAYALAKQRCPRLALTIAGDGAALEPAKRHVEEKRLEGVSFLGHIAGEEKAAALEAANCYLLPTYYPEGLPCSVVEAMAHGLPVITRPVAGLNDFFQDGEMGFLEPTLEPARFAEHIVRLATDEGLCARIGERNRAYAFEHFGASRAAARLENIYSALASEAVHK